MDLRFFPTALLLTAFACTPAGAPTSESTDAIDPVTPADDRPAAATTSPAETAAGVAHVPTEPVPPPVELEVLAKDVPATSGAVAAYRRAVAAYVDGDEAAYRDAFADRLDCFYGDEDVSAAQVVRARRPMLGAELRIHELRIVREQPEMVRLIDFGHYAEAIDDVSLVMHAKTVVMRRVGDAWKIAAESAGRETCGRRVRAKPSKAVARCRSTYVRDLARAEACRCADGTQACNGCQSGYDGPAYGLDACVAAAAVYEIGECTVGPDGADCVPLVEGRPFVGDPMMLVRTDGKVASAATVTAIRETEGDTGPAYVVQLSPAPDEYGEYLLVPTSATSVRAVDLGKVSPAWLPPTFARVRTECGEGDYAFSATAISIEGLDEPDMITAWCHEQSELWWRRGDPELDTSEVRWTHVTP